MWRRVLVVTAALAGCGASSGEDVAEVAPPGTCGADGLQGLVGQGEAVLATMRFTQTVRIIRPGMPVTMDYSAGRLNIETDARDRIARVFCG
ncbi:MAG: I78 family peptidase inhibitor [Paracoccaceae bacterium]